MIGGRIATACVLLAACRYDANLGSRAPSTAPDRARRRRADVGDRGDVQRHVSARRARCVAFTAWVAGAAGAMWRWDGQTLSPAASAGTDVAFDACGSERVARYAVGARSARPRCFSGRSTVERDRDHRRQRIDRRARRRRTDVRTWAIGHAFNFVQRPTTTAAWQRQSGQDLVYCRRIYGQRRWRRRLVVGNQGIARFARTTVVRRAIRRRCVVGRPWPRRE